jgi:hypothetical protein
MRVEMREEYIDLFVAKINWIPLQEFMKKNAFVSSY